MGSPSFTILDVGHGNCSVLIDSHEVLVFDACLGDLLLDFLEHKEIFEIHSVVLSHADKDHIAGVQTLLLDNRFVVHNIYVNPDSRRTNTWRLLRIALRMARERKGTNVNTQLTTQLSGKISGGAVQVEVLSPEPEAVLGGVGGIDLQGRPLHPHTLNAVFRLVKDGIPIALLTGDLDGRGLEELIRRELDLRARLLLFPHHGGLPGTTNPVEFATTLCSSVQPDLVVFSIGRGKHGTPRPEIVDTIRKSLPKTHIACTQLSLHCADAVPKDQPVHLSNNPAQDRSTNSCCAGTIVLDLKKPKHSVIPTLKRHLNFIKGNATTALCVKD